jgi:hypothetical protein
VAKIKASTLLRHPGTGEIVFLREDESAPSWAAKLITNPGVHPQPKADEPEAGDSQDEDPKGAEADGTQDEGDEPSDDKADGEASDKESAPTGRRTAAKK